MDQVKIERVLRLMKLMSGSVNFTVDELAERLGISYRSIYRYIDTFKSAGFAVEKVHGNTYRIMKMPRAVKDIENLVYFSEEEARVVSGLIQGLDGSNGLKANLYKKLSTIYDVTAIDRYVDNKDQAFNIQMLQEAMNDRKKVLLKDYSSSHSGTSHDILIEPYDFSGEYINVYGYDVERRENRVYKIARIGKVEPDGADWEYGSEHRKGYMDVFRMTGQNRTHVRLEMNLRAKNLLVEEFPMAESEVREEDGRWVLDTHVSHMQGVGRFVIGLAEDVKIVDSPELLEYVRNYVKCFVDRI